MSYYTYEEAIAAAYAYGLEEEVKYLMDHGFTPDEALREWDCEPQSDDELRILVWDYTRKHSTKNEPEDDAPEFDGAGFCEADNYIF